MAYPVFFFQQRTPIIKLYRDLFHSHVTAIIIMVLYDEIYTIISRTVPPIQIERSSRESSNAHAASMRTKRERVIRRRVQSFAALSGCSAMTRSIFFMLHSTRLIQRHLRIIRRPRLTAWRLQRNATIAADPLLHALGIDARRQRHHLLILATTRPRRRLLVVLRIDEQLTVGQFDLHLFRRVRTGVQDQPEILRIAFVSDDDIWFVSRQHISRFVAIAANSKRSGWATWRLDKRCTRRSQSWRLRYPLRRRRRYPPRRRRRYPLTAEIAVVIVVLVSPELRHVRFHAAHGSLEVRHVAHDGRLAVRGLNK